MFTDLIPAKYRKYVYAIAALLALGFGIWEASHGDWKVFVASLLAALVSGLAHGNVTESGDSSPRT